MSRRHRTSNAELRRELKLAEHLQRRLYPASAPSVAGFEIAGLSHSLEATNGDCFDYVSLQDGSVVVFVGDVQGHGLPAALVMVQTRAYLHAFAEDGADLATLAVKLDRVLANDDSVGYSVTGVFTRIRPGQRELEYINAGHPAPLAFGVEPRLLESTAPLLGVLPDSEFGAIGKLVVPTGAILLLYSDGVTEARDSSGEFFGESRLAQLIHNHPRASATVLCKRILHEVDVFRADVPQQDDMTCVIIRAVD